MGQLFVFLRCIAQSILRWITSIAERVWSWKWIGWALFSVFAVVAIYWHWAIPSPGKAVAVLAVAAAVMSFRAAASGTEKTVWMLLLFAFLYLELRAIDKDRTDTERSQVAARAVEQENFKAILSQESSDNGRILDQESKNVSAILTQQQTQFKTTIDALLLSAADEHKQFNLLFSKQEALFEHEQRLAESLNGNLTPAKDPTPLTVCGPTPAGAVFLMVGDENQYLVSIIRAFPHNVIVHQHGDAKIPILTLDKTSTGLLTVLLDLRSADGKIIARLNRDGFVVNRNNLLEMKRNASGLAIIDEYGHEALTVRYLNPGAIRVSGEYVKQALFAEHMCSSSGKGGGADVVFRD